MGPSRAANTSDRVAGDESSWPAGRRAAVSILLGLHLVAVVAAPWSGPPPASALSQRVASLFTPYLQAAYLNHGYRFFAPEPGPSHVVRYEFEMADGSIQQGLFPDVNRHWPRLLYHRHFMVSETVFNLTQPFIDSPDDESIAPNAREEFERQRERAFVLVRSLARYLMQQHGARRATLFIQAHHIPAPWELRAGMRLTDKRLYEERILGRFEREELLGPG